MTIGDKVIIRTMVYHYIGRVVSANDVEIVLEDASWLAESLRWSETLTTGAVRELEPYPDYVVIRVATIVDYSPWQHNLPRDPV